MGKTFKHLFSKTENALWLNLCIYYWEHLHVCSGYVTQVSEPWPVGLLFYSNIITFCESHQNWLRAFVGKKVIGEGCGAGEGLMGMNLFSFL